MKKTFTLFIALLLAGISLQAQAPKQYTLMTKRTADWCPRCGTWGWTFVKDGLKEWEGENLIFFANHFSGGLATPTSQALASNLGGNYQPVFHVNQDDLNVLSSNVNDKIQEAKSTINALNSFPPLIYVDINPVIDTDNNISVTATVSFVEGTDSDYTLGLYLVRDSLVANQASVGSQAVHPFIMDESFFNDAFGPLINSGNTINADDKFTIEATMDNVTPHSDNIENLKIVAIVWYEVGGQKTFINGDIQSVQMTSNNTELDNFTFQYSINQNNITIQTDEALTGEAQLSLYSINGMQVAVNTLASTSNSISVETPLLSPGAYVMRLVDGDRIAAKQIYIVE